MDDDVLQGVVELVAVGGTLLLALTNSFKGKYWFGLLTMVTGPTFGLIGAIRLAKPGSAWARRFYSRERMAQAIERFPDHAEGVELDPEARTAPPVGRLLGAVAIAVAAAMSARHL